MSAINIEVFGELPSGTTATIRFDLVEEADEEEYIALGRRALLDLHCDEIDSEVVA